MGFGSSCSINNRSSTKACAWSVAIAWTQSSRKASLPSSQRRGKGRQGDKNRGCAKAAADRPCCVQEQRILPRARGGSDLTFNTASDSHRRFPAKCKFQARVIARVLKPDPVGQERRRLRFEQSDDTGFSARQWTRLSGKGHEIAADIIHNARG